MSCRGDSRIARKQTVIVCKNGRRNASPTKTIKIRRGDHWSPAVFSNTHSQTKPLYVILSEKIAERFCSRSFVEGVSRRRRSDTRTEKRFAFRRDLRTNLGGFLYRCNIPLASHQNSLRDPANCFALCAFDALLLAF